ncbi:endonuclease III [candidate division WWE3 bacterium RIFOXYC1_FULL_40_10]|uniref:Endonuclease III n=1 Tax=candidate division WWE3 bacterium RIFOXYA2_FULL_46_9 TaxID=1802636 RepID=A0A1F4W1B7_UNCKA|nr:MAG: endonuclease III [candidate division WWE3 bacterium RIFOXYB1_FULL_40_22]OGC61309.1 MAG: endonuclease III [candidate division WWE3 bacterium RIFOXYA1_FULL_40_11]OGC63219.1 MAG: endonuclease III [candidate division WWE3 bacterium RIFOXYA2_FULL_46_9]OGC65300.1 MAG: endonuclease III [candidate division WWE3 bacterium RIFOXYB2_FULL_41_6]OGC65692.1 MAG: endonuclease III [candidate division WWE3 bacterium RIFOXYC1_FULL_40_10]OGC67739.1 MAG: endonuclease III [candidate division WWE3 bacterium 
MIKINENAEKIAQIFVKTYPNPKSELLYSNEFQFFVAVCLSAQTTDKKVNQVTEHLFKKYKGWEDLAGAALTLEQLRKDIHGVNFHIGKAERLVKASQMVIADFGGELPHTMAQLVRIPGVARKTANVLLNDLWEIAEGIVVDTHVTRVSTRLGLTEEKDAVKIERDLMQVFAKKYWSNLSNSIVLHGRYVCMAKNPKCAACVLNKVCPSAFSFE